MTTKSIDGFQTKVIKDLSINRASVNKEDFIEILNTISLELGGITNLGVFCDIESIEQSSALLADVEEQFIHVETEIDEQPDNKLENDGSSTNPYDYNFKHLLND